MELNNGYQNLYLNGLDISVGGSLEGLKEKIRDILPNKIVIVCGVAVGSEKKLPIGVEVKKYITYTEEPEDWDEEEQGEFIPEEVYNLEIKNLYGYDLTIVDDVVSSTATQVATYGGVESLIEGGTIENAKPIYCHPLTLLLGESGINGSITMLVFNNDPTPFDTSTFLAWLQDLYTQVGDTIRVMISGAFKKDSSVVIGSFLGKSAAYPITLNGYDIDGNYTGLTFASNTLFSQAVSLFIDGVNKIN